MFENIFKAFNPASLQVSLILSQVKVMHVMDGRIRVVYAKLKHDDEMYAQICAQLKSIKEIDAWKINRTTGSITIEYTQKNIVKNSFLDRLIKGATADYKA